MSTKDEIIQCKANGQEMIILFVVIALGIVPILKSSLNYLIAIEKTQNDLMVNL